MDIFKYLDRKNKFHLIFIILILIFILIYYILINVLWVNTSESYISIEENQLQNINNIQSSQPQFRTENGKNKVEIDFQVDFVDEHNESLRSVDVFLLDPKMDLFWLTKPRQLLPEGEIVSLIINNKTINFQISMPEFLVSPGIYKIGVELCFYENQCSYYIHKNRFLVVSSNYMQIIKKSNFEKMDSTDFISKLKGFLKDKFLE